MASNYRVGANIFRSEQNTRIINANYNLDKRLSGTLGLKIIHTSSSVQSPQVLIRN